MLTDGARADSVPNLEIETGEIVGAGHASATGRFDDEQLFYLQARGIPEDEARRLVVRGFFAELVAADRRATSSRTACCRAIEAELEPRWPASEPDAGGGASELRARRAPRRHARRAAPCSVERRPGRRSRRPHADGEVYAVDDVCSHAEVALSEGEVDGCTIECWLHGSRFDLRTGKPTGCRPPSRSPSIPSRSSGDDVLVDVSSMSRSH